MSLVVVMNTKWSASGLALINAAAEASVTSPSRTASLIVIVSIDQPGNDSPMIRTHSVSRIFSFSGQFDCQTPKMLSMSPPQFSLTKSTTQLPHI